jgi:hypothetical protein
MFFSLYHSQGSLSLALKQFHSIFPTHTAHKKKISLILPGTYWKLFSISAAWTTVGLLLAVAWLRCAVQFEGYRRCCGFVSFTHSGLQLLQLRFFTFPSGTANCTCTPKIPLCTKQTPKNSHISTAVWSFVGTERRGPSPAAALKPFQSADYKPQPEQYTMLSQLKKLGH